MDALTNIRDVIVGIYEMMNALKLNVFGFVCTLWDLYFYGLVAMVALYIFWKIVRS